MRHMTDHFGISRPLALAADGCVPPLVSMGVVYIQFKGAGMFLLAGRLCTVVSAGQDRA